jgi:predicted NBD/HSP70 family sugar kinase
VKKLAGNWQYDAASVGYPGVGLKGRVAAEPYNLGRGWVGFDFAAAFGCPVKLLNDAAMQALGCYQSDTMLFLGLGTGLGTAMIVDGVVIPMEIGHLPYRKGTFEDYLGLRGLRRLGRKKWGKHVAAGVACLTAALHPDEVVLGGGNSRQLKALPPGCRVCDNANALLGGFRLWESAKERTPSPLAKARLR